MSDMDPSRRARAETARPRLLADPEVRVSLASGVLLGLGWAGALLELPPVLVTGVYLLSALAGGFFFAREAITDLVRERQVGIDMLMTVAAVVAFWTGHAGEAAMLAFLYSISEAVEEFTEEKTRHAVRALMDLTPKEATVRRDGKTLDVRVEEVRSGDVFTVCPGGSVPTDGVVESGSSTVNQASVTGESMPVAKARGEEVFAGSINDEGSLEIRATADYSENTLSRIIHLVEEAQESKGRSQRTIERFGRVYSPLVLAAGILVALVPPLVLGTELDSWVGRGTVLLVAGAPCALVISIPVTFVAALGRAARSGILIKGGIHLEELARVKVVALDKTGTLTLGDPGVTDILPLDGSGSEDDLLALAAAVEARSEHPLARAIVQEAEARDLRIEEVTEFQSRTGFGATARDGERSVRVGSLRLFEDAENLEPARESSRTLRSAGKTVVFVGDDSGILGLIGLRDHLRPGAKDALRSIRESGIERIVMLTGDNLETATAIAQEAGITDFRAELRPEDKLTAVQELAREFGDVAMVGDGVNDAPALAAASVGIAMGAAGTDVALETADVALMADDLGRISEAIRFSRRTRQIVLQNLTLSVIVITAMVIGAILGELGLPVTVIAHEISEFVVIGNGLRMLHG